MTREEHMLMNRWNHEYYDRHDRDHTSASDCDYSHYDNNGEWHDPRDPVTEEEMAAIKHKMFVEKLRFRDIRDTYRMMDPNPQAILEKLQARGTCTIGDPPEPKEVNEVEEDEGEEFLFDPEELDL
jgi:hypothetical protein